MDHRRGEMAGAGGEQNDRSRVYKSSSAFVMRLTKGNGGFEKQ